MKLAVLFLALSLAGSGSAGSGAADSNHVTPKMDARHPVIVELFTSEGCSSCPPADALLEKLDQTQPIPGAMIIALSEHVDYWNYIGWKDPWSSALYSRRQSGYSDRFRLSSVYTPQMVVSGEQEMVGDDAGRIRDAVVKASREDSHEITISPVQNGSAAMVDIHVSPSAKAGRENASVVIAIAENATVSHVLRGENSGRTLRHVAVVLSLNEAGKLAADGSFHKQIPLPADASMWKGKRIVAFVQDANYGPIRGAASRVL